MLGALTFGGLAGVYLYNKREKEVKSGRARVLPDIPSSVLGSLHQKRVKASQNLHSLYNTTAMQQRRAMIAAPPFSGQAETLNPRIPPPHLHPTPKQASRLDWRAGVSDIFNTEHFRSTYKRIHQIVYGTPTAQARKGLLQVDWGHSKEKGYPIHKGRVQDWLPMGSSRFPASGILPVDQTKVVMHFDLGGYLNKNRRRRNPDYERKPEGDKIFY